MRTYKILQKDWMLLIYTGHSLTFGIYSKCAIVVYMHIFGGIQYFKNLACALFDLIPSEICVLAFCETRINFNKA